MWKNDEHLHSMLIQLEKKARCVGLTINTYKTMIIFPENTNILIINVKFEKVSGSENKIREKKWRRKMTRRSIISMSSIYQTYTLSNEQKKSTVSEKKVILPVMSSHLDHTSILIKHVIHKFKFTQGTMERKILAVRLKDRNRNE